MYPVKHIITFSLIICHFYYLLYGKFIRKNCIPKTKTVNNKNGGAMKMNIPNKKNNSGKDSNPPKNDKQNKKGKKFYIALAICLTAISAAAWSTYQSVKDFIVPSKSHSAGYTSSSPSTNKTSSQNQEKDLKPDKKKSEEKPSLRGRRTIPYDNASKKAENFSADYQDDSEETQAVSAQKSDAPVIYPSGNHITKEFSDGKPVYSKTMNDWRCHNGTDFEAQAGSAVKSITDGVVKDVYTDSSYGVTVKIEHNSGFTAYYSGLGETVSVKKDDKVSSGQEIGSVAKVPCEIADESHIHISVFKDGKFIDPLLVLEKDNQ